MERAEERFSELPNQDDIVKNTYVVAPRIRWQGMLSNPLCSFWGDELSKVWAGTEIEKPKTKQKGIWDEVTQILSTKEPRTKTRGWLADDKEQRFEWYFYFTTLVSCPAL